MSALYFNVFVPSPVLHSDLPSYALILVKVQNGGLKSLTSSDVRPQPSINEERLDETESQKEARGDDEREVKNLLDFGRPRFEEVPENEKEDENSDEATSSILGEEENSPKIEEVPRIEEVFKNKNLHDGFHKSKKEFPKLTSDGDLTPNKTQKLVKNADHLKKN